CLPRCGHRRSCRVGSARRQCHAATRLAGCLAGALPTGPLEIAHRPPSPNAASAAKSTPVPHIPHIRHAATHPARQFRETFCAIYGHSLRVKEKRGEERAQEKIHSIYAEGSCSLLQRSAAATQQRVCMCEGKIPSESGNG